tara:strand:- start:2649 stop:2939 length:291 start_codon:yes stop_codon:yes gene_type:complete
MIKEDGNRTMTQEQKSYLEKAMQDPGDLFGVPEDVLQDDRLSDEAKVKVLRNWADEMKHILESKAENMHPEICSTAEEALLQKISKTLSGLGRQGS